MKSVVPNPMEQFKFVDGHFVAESFQCECGREHAAPIREVIVKPGALRDVAAMLDRLNVGRHGLVVADLNTWDAAGEDVVERLREAGYTISLSLFNTRDAIHPDEYAVGKVLFDLEPEITFLLVVGSGVLTDTTRVISYRTGVPFISVATAASMDGYASVGAPMLINGLKKSLYVGAPIAILADVDVLCAAPFPMTAAGFGDLLGKLNSRVDWKLAHIVAREYYCQTVIDMVSEAVDACVAQAAGIREHSPDALATLIEGLILSGVGMLMVGNSRPASGSEHHLSHYWEMKAITENRPEHFHGKKVGVGTAVMAKFYEKFFARDPFAVDLDDVKARKESFDVWEGDMHKTFGPVAESLIALKAPAFQEWDQQRKTIETIQNNWQQILRLRKLEPTYDQIVEILNTAGAAYLPSEVDVDLDYLRETLLHAKDVRTQYTVMTVADTLGWLEEIVDEIISEYAAG